MFVFRCLPIILCIFAALACEALGEVRKRTATRCADLRQKPLRTKIVGGHQAALVDWPSFAALRLNSPQRRTAGYFCGATRINARWLITAAHCVEPILTHGKKRGRSHWAPFEVSLPFHRAYEGRVEVVYGVDDLRDEKNASVRTVTDIIVHPSYDAYSLKNDVALIAVDEQMIGPYAVLSDKIAYDPPSHTADSSMVAGHGLLSLQGQGEWSRSDDGTAWSGSMQLLEVPAPIVATSHCKALLETTSIDGSQICAGRETGGRDSCKADSGGPLVTFDNSGCPYQIGIVSWGKGCAAAGQTGVYSRVSYYASWVRKVAGTISVPHQNKIRNWAADQRSWELSQRLREQLDKLALGRLGLTVSILGADGASIGGAPIPIGTKLAIRVTPGRHGMLFLFAVNPRGEVSRLPFQHNFEDRRDVRIPVKMTGPAGEGFVAGFLVPDGTLRALRRRLSGDWSSLSPEKQVSYLIEFAKGGASSGDRIAVHMAYYYAVVD